MSSASTVLIVPFYPASSQVLFGSIIAANPTATTVAIACSSDTNNNGCLWPDTVFTLTSSSGTISSTWDIISTKPATDQETNLIEPRDTTIEKLSCDVQSRSVIGICTSVYEAYITGRKSTLTTTETWTNPVVTLTPKAITITAGLDKLVLTTRASTTPPPANKGSGTTARDLTTAPAPTAALGSSSPGILGSAAPSAGPISAPDAASTDRVISAIKLGAVDSATPAASAAASSTASSTAVPRSGPSLASLGTLLLLVGLFLTR